MYITNNTDNYNDFENCTDDKNVDIIIIIK